MLIATANKDLYDFNSSPNSYKYYGVVELNELFARHGFKAEFFGDTPVGEVSMRQRVLRPVKRLAVMLGVMPKTTGGKKWLKRIVFGGLVEMPGEIGPQINGRKKAQESQNKNKKEINGRPGAMRSAVVNELHGINKKAQESQKCPQISQINADLGANDSGIPQGKQNEKDDKTLYRGRYVEPEWISSEEANTCHKVIYCVASLE